MKNRQTIPSCALPGQFRLARLACGSRLVLALVFALSVVAQPDRPLPGGGPWNNDVMVYRVAASGAAERRATFERAGVPTLTRLTNGRLLAAHQHFPENNPTDFDKVAVRFSPDEGKTWSDPQVIRVAGLPDGMRFPFDPTLVSLPDGRVRLYFTGNYGRTFQDSVPAIHSAISTNGMDYTYEPGVRFGVAERDVIDCAVVLHHGVFHLYAPIQGARLQPGKRPDSARRPPEGRGYHATSTNGLDFTRVADVQVEGRRRWLGNAQSDGALITFFGSEDFAPGQPGQPRSGVWSATSADGVTWEQARSLPVPGADPGAVKLRDGSWLLLVTGPPVRDELPPPRRLPNTRPPQPGGVHLRLDSPAAGAEGIAASVFVPRQPRFTDGAPVVIQVAGGVLAGSARGRPEYMQHGFVEIHFAFPGGGQGEERSGGTYDFRGPNCIRALADVIRFATGRTTDRAGRRIHEVARRVPVLTNHVGLVGSSHGGNACGLVMALHGEEFPELAWYASMESPYGEGAANIELGGREEGLNPAYDPKTGSLDLSRLAWSPELSPGLRRRPMPTDTRQLKGALFFDLDGDGRFSPEADFPVNCLVGDAGHGVKAWYSPRILAAAEECRLLPATHPAHVPTLAGAREFWRYRDAAPSIPEAVRKCPKLAVIVYANERDHVQADPASTHILEQVEGFRKAGARFVRLNPDRAYVEGLLRDAPDGRREARFPDNPVGKVWTRANITEGLEPSALPPGLYMQAAVCELADRTHADNWSPDLDAALFPSARKAGREQQSRPAADAVPPGL